MTAKYSEHDSKALSCLVGFGGFSGLPQELLASGSPPFFFFLSGSLESVRGFDPFRGNLSRRVPRHGAAEPSVKNYTKPGSTNPDTEFRTCLS